MSLKINGLNKAFDKKVIFSSFEHTFSDTGLYLVSGKSGVGKTTLLRIIAGLDKNYSGTVLGGGVKNVSFAFQEYRLFPNLSALNNVLLAAFNDESAENKKATVDMLRYFEFTDEDMNLSPDELSGGMKQRVSLARAFLKDCPILILDEPTKELDSRLRKKVVELIEKEAKKRLVILVTHTAEDVEGLQYTKIVLDAN